MKDERTVSFFCTGVYATEDEIKRMKDEYATPLIVVGGRVPCPALVMHQCALAHGLPEIEGHYGCDFRDGEFLREKNALEGSLPDSSESPAKVPTAKQNDEDSESKNTMWDFGPDDGG